MLADLVYRAGAFLRRRAVDAEFEEEFRFHLEQQAEQLVRSGLSPPEARRQARLMFGGFDRAKEECHEAQGSSVLDDLAQDLRYAARLHRRSPIHSAFAVLSLAFCIAASLLLWSASYQVVFGKAPVVDPGRLVVLESPEPILGTWVEDHQDVAATAFSYPMYLDLQNRASVFSGVLARFSWKAALSYKLSQPEPVDIEMVSGNYFEVLGVGAAVGRVFTEEDDRYPESSPAVVLSYSFWKCRFGGDASVVGRTLSLNHTPMKVIGVSAQDLHSLLRHRPVDIHLPISMREVFMPKWQGFSRHDLAWVRIIARLSPGVTLQRAEVEASKLYQQWLQREAEAMPVAGEPREHSLGRTLKLIPFGRGVDEYDTMNTFFLELVGLVGALWFISCASVAALYMARSTARVRELATRVAIGADRARVARQLMAEGLALAVPAALLGLLLAWGAAQPSLGVLFDFGRVGRYSLVPGPLAFSFWLLLSALTAVAIGWAPRFQPWLAKLRRISRSARPMQAKVRWGALPLTLVALQVALSIWLTSYVLMMNRDVRLETSSELGFRKENLFRCGIDAPDSGLGPEQMQHLYIGLQQRLAAVPGVEAVGASSIDKRMYGVVMTQLETDDQLAGTSNSRPVHIALVSPGYFEAAGYTVIAGRVFRQADLESRGRAGMVNETLAGSLFGGRNPVGKRVRPVGEDSWIEIVGWVRDERHITGYRAARPFLYLPSVADGLAFYIRSRTVPEQLLSKLGEAVGKEVPGAVVYWHRPPDIEEDAHYLHVEYDVFRWFTVVAALLAAVAVAQVMASAVQRRTTEIGVRMTLGAPPGSIAWMMMRDVLVVIGAGSAAGWICAIGFGRLMLRAFKIPFYDIPRSDYQFLAAATAISALVVAAAGLLPAVRAARIDPAISLRAD